MDPVTANVLIDRPREEVFDYLADIANHQEFSDHYLKDWRLTRVDSVGRGAGARFKIDAPLDRFGWGDMTFIEVDRPYKIVAAGRAGKFNRNKTWTTWTLSPSGNATQVEVITESETTLLTWQSHASRARAARGTGGCTTSVGPTILQQTPSSTILRGRNGPCDRERLDRPPP